MFEGSGLLGLSVRVIIGAVKRRNHPSPGDKQHSRP
jgi:hypothetical protein